MKKEKRSFGKILMVLTLIFFYLPIVYMVIFSFNSGKSLTSFSGFSLRWYRHMMESHTMMESLYTTFSIALIATAISTVVGTISAIGLSKSKKIVQNLMEQVNNLPMMNPEIVTAIGFMLLFITFRVEKGYVTMLLAHIAFCIPYVMLSVMPKIRSLDPNLADAAMDLGATPWRALTKVIVPQIMPGIVSGALIAFTMSIDDFIISYFVTGGGVKNLSITVYTMSKRVNPEHQCDFHTGCTAHHSRARAHQCCSEADGAAGTEGRASGTPDCYADSCCRVCGSRSACVCKGKWRQFGTSI